MTIPWNTGWTVHLYDQYGEECVGYDPQPLDGYIKELWVENTVIRLTTHPVRFFFVGPLKDHRRIVGCGIKSWHRGIVIAFSSLSDIGPPATYGDILNLSLDTKIPMLHWAALDLREPRLAA